MLSRGPHEDWLTEHRRIWARKPFLRAVYERWFALLRGRCGGGPIVELGCGPGFFKQAFPEVVSTDVTPNPYADCLADARALPFAADTLGAIVMIDVFHHLPDPAAFLREAGRALRPGGRVVLIEPWISVAGRLLWTYLHHEDCDLAVSPAAPWGGGAKDPMDGNAALPWLYFRPGGELERLSLDLTVVERQPFAGLPWLMSGGFQPVRLAPGGLAAWIERLDRAVSRLPAWTATRCVITLERAARPSAIPVRV